jgi:hypothetical protein
MADGRKNRRGLVLEGSSSSFIGDGSKASSRFRTLGPRSRAKTAARKLCKKRR